MAQMLALTKGQQTAWQQPPSFFKIKKKKKLNSLETAQPGRAVLLQLTSPATLREATRPTPQPSTRPKAEGAMGKCEYHTPVSALLWKKYVWLCERYHAAWDITWGGRNGTEVSMYRFPHSCFISLYKHSPDHIKLARCLGGGPRY